MRNTSDTVVGTIHQNCGALTQNPAVCTGIITFSGDQGSISYTVELPTTTGNIGVDSVGTVNGGTKTFKGQTGEIHFTKRSAGHWDVNSF
ncbi:hypothetical protein ACFWXK_39445 [Streptomyces sp. NPDC059070]|uniref:hypothetical protein n=1 Tax=Streptomyces sp. NPDC059070 TaxID=3346713 RepID=UPI00367C6011